MLLYNRTMQNRGEEIDLTVLICLTKLPKLLASCCSNYGLQIANSSVAQALAKNVNLPAPLQTY